MLSPDIVNILNSIKPKCSTPRKQEFYLLVISTSNWKLKMVVFVIDSLCPFLSHSPWYLESSGVILLSVNSLIQVQPLHHQKVGPGGRDKAHLAVQCLVQLPEMVKSSPCNTSSGTFVIFGHPVSFPAEPQFPLEELPSPALCRVLVIWQVMEDHCWILPSHCRI